MPAASISLSSSLAAFSSFAVPGPEGWKRTMTLECRMGEVCFSTSLWNRTPSVTFSVIQNQTHLAPSRWEETAEIKGSSVLKSLQQLHLCTTPRYTSLMAERFSSFLSLGVRCSSTENTGNPITASYASHPKPKPILPSAVGISFPQPWQSNATVLEIQLSLRRDVSWGRRDEGRVRRHGGGGNE